MVIGILIALQINTWNELQKNKTKEKAILSSIHEEFTRNKIQFDSVLAHHKKSYKACEKLINRFPITVRNENLDSLGLDLTIALDGWTFNPSQGTINGLINSSSLDLISDNELREILVSWPDLILDLQEDENIAKDVIDNFLDPYLSNHLDFNMFLKDPRVNLEVFETLKFEYLIQLRYNYLKVLFTPGQELETTQKHLDRILQLTATKNDD